MHDPIQPPVLKEPTVQDAKALADRVHDIVARPIEDARPGRSPLIASRRSGSRGII